MKNAFYLLATVATLAIGSSSLAADKDTVQSQTKVKSDSQGNYEKTTSVKEENAAGTTTTQDTKVKVKANADGTVDKTTEVETTTDPKGIMNKTTEKVSEVEKNSDGTKKVTHKKKVNGKVVEEHTATEKTN